MKKPNISVVIPMYNKAAQMQRTLESVYAQSTPAFEVIVVDDGSTDASASVVKANTRDNLTLIRQSNAGVSAARNRGIEAARGEYIAFLDADDCWLPLYLTHIAHLINRFPGIRHFATSYQCVEPGQRFVDADIAMQDADPQGILMRDYFAVASSGNLPFMISSSVLHKDVLAELGGFPEGEHIGEDQDLFCRIALNEPTAYSSAIALLYHRDAGNHLTHRDVPSSECPFSARLTQRAMQDRGLSQRVRRDIRRYSAAHLCHLAKLNIAAGHSRAALALLADSRCQSKPAHRIGLAAYALTRPLIAATAALTSQAVTAVGGRLSTTKE